VGIASALCLSKTWKNPPLQSGFPDLTPQEARFGSGEKHFDTARQAIILIMEELSPSNRERLGSPLMKVTFRSMK